ncbi:MAG: cytoplasmic protein [Actinobacteria bacterium]|nr:cytoplasmic protein [Actinomycetota bacterium]
MKSTYLPYSGREGEIKNKVLFERCVTGTLCRWHEYGNKDYHAKYVGEIENGKPYGQGKLTFPNGNKYEGEWKDGKYDGQGTITFSNGDKLVGEYKDGKPWNVKGYDKNENITNKVVNGKKIKN